MKASRALGARHNAVGTGSEGLIRERTGNRWLVLFDSGDHVRVEAGEDGSRLEPKDNVKD